MSAPDVDPGVRPRQYRCSRAEITDAMRMYGGGFVKQLAALLSLADLDNQRKLEAAFSDYFHQYDELASMKKETRD